MIQKYKWVLLLGVLYTVVLLVALHGIYEGTFPFWYDPARDLLSGWDNLSHLTLLGPTSGIPGIFYGPYWIWLLSFGLLFSKDPRVVVLIVSIVPYFILFPFVLSRFSRMADKRVLFLLGLLFLVNFQEYATALWNPYPAPLIALIALLVLTLLDVTKRTKNTLLMSVIAGFLLGLLVNFHISFGIGFFVGVCLYLLIQLIAKRKFWKNVVIHIVLIFAGLGIAFLPFFAFELRHQFTQTHTALNALLHYGNVVALKGLSKRDILTTFFGRGGRLFSLSGVLALLVGIVVAMWGGVFGVMKRAKLSEEAKRLLLLLTTVSSVVMFIYLTAKNPVWDYHFIGVSVLFLLLLAFLISQLRYGLYILTVITFVVVAVHTYNYISVTKKPVAYQASMAADAYTTRLITKDARGQDYTVFAYSSSFYSYDYSYMFRWIAHKDVPYRPELVSFDVPTAYIIIPPKTKKGVVTDLLNYRTPDKVWRTSQRWTAPDGTTIIKRTKISSVLDLRS